MTMDCIFRMNPGVLTLYFVCIALFYPVSGQNGPEVAEVLAHGAIGEHANLSCVTAPSNAAVQWLFNGQPVVANDRIKIWNSTLQVKLETEIKDYRITNISVANATRSDGGNYSCVATSGSSTVAKMEILDLSFPGQFVDLKQVIRANASDKQHVNDVTLTCVFELYNDEPTVHWWQVGTEEYHPRNTSRTSDKRLQSTYIIKRVGNQHNGTYQCRVYDTISDKNISGYVEVLVYDKPHVVLDTVIGISKSQLFFNWTVFAYNANITMYTLSYCDMKCPSGFVYSREQIGTNNTSFVLGGLNKSTEYKLKLSVQTTYAKGEHPNEKSGVTLEEDPNFVPNISINGFTATSVTIGWASPPESIAHLIHYYLLEARKKDGGAPRKAYHSRDFRNLPYMFDNLEPYSTYIFKARACQDYTHSCGNWSEEMEAATLDGVPGAPSNVTVTCTTSQMFLTWDPPIRPNAEIKGYTMELTGVAVFKDRGLLKRETFGPLARFKSNDSRNARFDELQPNTNYTVRVTAMTRSRRRGDEEIRHCMTRPAAPDMPPRPRWRKILENEQYMFKMYMPKVSERNGPICCYRVYMVRMLPSMDLKDLKPQKQLEIIDYEDAHAVQPIQGAYITDIFTNDNFPQDDELIMGDGVSLFNKSDPVLNTPACRRCLRQPPRAMEPPKVTSTATTTTEDLDDGITDDPIPVDQIETLDQAEQVDEKRKRRSIDMERDYSNMAVMSDARAEERTLSNIKDGPLDSNANYTLFVELIPGVVEEESLYSDYISPLRPAPTPALASSTSELEIALQATCGAAAVSLLVMIIFCVRHTRRSQKLHPRATVEMNPIQAALRYVVGHMGGRQQLVSSVPPDMPPIAREDLAAAYAERHADSDYGFQKEFELLQMLSECFADRTTHASEARENQPKNRYPDIKAYDQTRVKLAQIDSITGSDYINANYVMGYKESKQFICAQGPTDTTVNDFWRMVWEQGLELIVMLTNLEEYSKVKCSKYWPDDGRGSKAFGAITVQHVGEKRYSDYIVRELKVTKQPTNSEGQPIVENNGVNGAKRNGDVNQSESAPTSPRDRDPKEESRVVKQYHFLMWKDFAAPEHPQSILKFIKRVNEAWSHMVGRPVVVHCSAGVGRTGTLVALDCLLDQLRDTDHVSVFNTVAELRRQRNFLVQSQKQYVFVYRALVEWAHYGDTEISARRLKAAVDRLRNTPEGADRCLMEHEFEKLLESPVLEPVKSCAAAELEENRPRNRSQECLPYDRNRVMLTPSPNDYCTYINASLLEAYDNSEGFIITQDPLAGTIFDFWRMVSEQGVNTIVMLSELGEGKCPRYWDDGTATYEHMAVTYDESEACPYYTRRQFRVTNNKSGETQAVRQLQYQGWPTAPGHVPEVTRGLAELADAAGTAQPMLVHCHTGTERSALFVALCILITQLRTERRVDVNAVARKVRSQRARTIDTFTQYEFLHRAILNYAELHNLLDDNGS